jgi:hypothetical protein
LTITPFIIVRERDGRSNRSKARTAKMVNEVLLENKVLLVSEVLSVNEA